MRLLSTVLALSLSAVPAAAIAAPLTSSSSSVGWADGQARGFLLTWDGQQAVFSIEGIGTASYGSVETCCEDLIGRAGSIRPGGYFELSQLVINSIPLSTTVQDTLDLSMLRQTALYNVGRMSGQMTLRWEMASGPDPTDTPYDHHEVESRYSSMMVRSVRPTSSTMDFSFESQGAPVPEPAMAVLFGLGLLGAAGLARRRRR